MAEKNLRGLRVAILATDGFEQVELTEPRKVLKAQGARVDIVSLKPGKIRGMNHMYPGTKVEVDWTVFEAEPRDYDALVIPGGLINPDMLRQSDEALEFVRAFDMASKPIAVICHGPWLLVSSGRVQGRRLTSWPGIKDDVMNAGGDWTDDAVVHDGNWISSRGPHDLPQFCEAMVQLFGRVAPAKSEAEPATGFGKRAKWGAIGAITAAAAGIAAWQLSKRSEGTNGNGGSRERDRDAA